MKREKMEYIIIGQWVIVYIDGALLFSGFIKNNHMGTIHNVLMFDTEAEMNDKIIELGFEIPTYE